MTPEELRALLAEKIGVAPELVTRDADLLCDLGADSLCIAEIAGIIESRTNKQIQLDCMMDIETVGDLEDFLAPSQDMPS